MLQQVSEWFVNKSFSLRMDFSSFQRYRTSRVVIGASFGDECKGLVSSYFARTKDSSQRLLTVLFNGGAQRAHTIHCNNEDIILHNVGAGNYFGGETYYHPMFLVDPIALMITNEKVIIDSNCRVVLPCDVIANRMNKETIRHGTCGMGIFECAKRSATERGVTVRELLDDYALYQKIKNFGRAQDRLYNLDNFMAAVSYIKSNCKIACFDDIKYDYDLIIFEGGQGLMLDQSNLDYFPYLTPSSTGSRNIAAMVDKLTDTPEIYYVSRSYITRHGNGILHFECDKNKINPLICDNTNIDNDWQHSLRFAALEIDELEKRIITDSKFYKGKANINIVYTHLNYTDSSIYTNLGLISIPRFDTIGTYGSWDKTDIHKLSQTIVVHQLKVRRNKYSITQRCRLAFRVE